MAWALRIAEGLVELMEEGQVPEWFPKLSTSNALSRKRREEADYRCDRNANIAHVWLFAS
jgi:hypothetical protein